MDCCEACGRNKADEIRERVRKGYSDIARRPGTCCGTTAPDALAGKLGYSEAELATLPEGANLGLSCGNPTALASLRQGEVVVDLGSGGGFDVFLAAQRVGPTGRAIGVDMTPEMVTKSRQNAVSFRERTGLDNVEFRLGEIEHLPVPDGSVDVVISNCVINLSPDKPQVWREIARVLKPTGRAVVTDIGVLKPLPDAVKESAQALLGCLAGAIPISETEAMIPEAGLELESLTKSPEHIEAMTASADPLYQEIAAAGPEGTKPTDYATSMAIVARKPA